MARPKSNIRERLLAAARKRFLMHGVDGASLRDIGKDARTSAAMVTYWFRTKDELFLAVVEETYVHIMAGIRAAMEQEPVPVGYTQSVERLIRAVHGITDVQFQVMRIILREAMISSKRLAVLFKRFSGEDGHVALMWRIVGQGVVSGELRDDVPPMILVASTMALLVAPLMARKLIFEQLTDLEAPGPAEVAGWITKVLTQGVLAGPRPGSG
ncbi:MAG: TetR/AcrR family transcriptional regulator [Deltaproteobacteria bacterium]|nr:TetR/AcrR family transcriptional regulator [Deltaproteobacteria bacterium]